MANDDSADSVVVITPQPSCSDVIKIEGDACFMEAITVDADCKSSMERKPAISGTGSLSSLGEIPGSPVCPGGSNTVHVPTACCQVQISDDVEERCPTLLEDMGFSASYASDDNAIYVTADIYDREKSNFDALVQETLSAEKQRLKLETESKDNTELLEAQQRVLKLNERLILMSKCIDNLRAEDDDEHKSKAETQSDVEQKPSWSHLYAGINKYRHKAEGSEAEFYQHKSNIISGLKTLYQPDGQPPSAADFAEQPKALCVSLLQHQKVALKWLLWRESQKIRGGILADDMGLGKTLSMIALILASNEQKQKETASTKTHFDYKKSWEQQLQLYENHKTQFKRISIFDDSDGEEEPPLLPAKREYLPTQPEDEDDNEFLDERKNSAGTLVICPMSVMSQWASEATTKVNKHALKVHIYHGSARREVGRSNMRRMDLVITSYSTAVSEWTRDGRSSWLFCLDWERLILDEAHIIRNTKTSCCQAVSSIAAQNHWALTGTPIQNRALDCFALLKFLRVPNFKDLQQWRRYLNEGIAGHRRMSFLVKPLMLRRTKLQLQASGDMPPLPPLEVKLIDVDLSPSELTVYKILSAISLKIFVQFLRQREQNNQDLNYYANESTPSFIKDEIDSKYHAMYNNFLCSIGYNPRERVQGIVILVLLLRLRQFCCHPGLMVKMLCGEMDEDESDEEDNLESGQQGDLNGGALKKTPKDDKTGIKKERKPVKKEDFMQDIKFSLKEEQSQSIDDKKPITKKESPNESVTQEEESFSNMCTDDAAISVEMAMKLLRPNNPIFELKRSSAKLKLIFATLERLLLETKDKIIVVSQWTSFLLIIKEHLDSLGHETLEFNGKMDAAQRSETLSEFNQTYSNKRILLLSLTAGGVGLNLNVANHLLMVDLHWNPQLERQAQDRIYRYGQKKQAYIYRFMCKDTVEQRIKALQDYKMEISNVVLNPDAVDSSTDGNGLSLKDLKKIFGM